MQQLSTTETYDTKLWNPIVSSKTSIPTTSATRKTYPLPIPTIDGTITSDSTSDSIVPNIYDIFNTLPQPDITELIPQLTEPASLLAQGFTIGFPTETVYGLGGNALNDRAISRIYEAKGRPSDNPLIVHVSNADQLAELTTYTCPLARRLMAAFWPGPLTIIMPDSGKASIKVTANLGTVGIRMPDHPIALALIQESKVPIAAPSANTSGRPSPTTAAHVMDDLHGRIAGIVQGPDTKPIWDNDVSATTGATTTGATTTRSTQCEYGVESTVVDISHLSQYQDIETYLNEDNTISIQTHGPPLVYILRPGGITKHMLESIVGVGRVEFDPSLLISAEKAYEDSERDSNPLYHSITNTTATGLQPRAPGMKYTHYAPKAPLYVVLDHIDEPSSRYTALQQHILNAKEKNQKVGVLTTYELESSFQNIADVVLPCGTRNNMMSIAAQLYDTLRLFDEYDVDIIFSESFESDELGAAVMNRLLKAAGGKVLRGSDGGDSTVSNEVDNITSK